MKLKFMIREYIATSNFYRLKNLTVAPVSGPDYFQYLFMHEYEQHLTGLGEKTSNRQPEGSNFHPNSGPRKNPEAGASAKVLETNN